MASTEASYCWSGMAAVVLVGLLMSAITPTVMYFLKLERGSAVGLLFLVLLLLLRSVMPMDHCLRTSAISPTSMAVLCVMLLTCHLLFDGSLIATFAGYPLNVSIVFMLLGYLGLCYVSPPLADGTRGAVPQMLQRTKQRWANSVKPENNNGGGGGGGGGRYTKNIVVQQSSNTGGGS